MKFLKTYCRNTLFWPIIIIIVSAFLRLILLDKIPNGINGDELIYVLNAKAIALTGSDITGTWNPLSAFIFRTPPNELQAELPYFIHLPFAVLFPFSLFWARFPFAIMSVLIVLFTYLITQKLLGTKIAILASAVAVFNPWLLFIGRTGYDSTPAVMFYLVGMYILLTARGKKVLLSIPILILAFYSYIGTKVILVPFVLTNIIYVWNKNKINRKYYKLIFLFSIFLTGIYIILLKMNPQTTRLSEIITPSMSLTGVINQMAEKVFAIFNIGYLFLHGDNFFGFHNHGLFYIPDFVFFLIGISTIYTKNKKIFIFLLANIFIGILPHLARLSSTENFTHHIYLMFPFFIITIATGINLVSQTKKTLVGKIMILFVLLLYIFSSVMFLKTYFLKHPLDNHYDFHNRILSSYIKKAHASDDKVIVYSNAPQDLFKKYIFYNNLYNRKTAELISDSFRINKFAIQNVEFTSCDNTTNVSDVQKKTSIFDIACGQRDYQKHLSISRLSDGGEIFQIYNDRTCSGFKLNPYPENISINDFAVEKLSLELFCQKYISSLP